MFFLVVLSYLEILKYQNIPLKVETLIFAQDFLLAKIVNGLLVLKLFQLVIGDLILFIAPTATTNSVLSE